MKSYEEFLNFCLSKKDNLCYIHRVNHTSYIGLIPDTSSSEQEYAFYTFLEEINLHIKVGEHDYFDDNVYVDTQKEFSEIYDLMEEYCPSISFVKGKKLLLEVERNSKIESGRSRKYILIQDLYKIFASII